MCTKLCWNGRYLAFSSTVHNTGFGQTEPAILRLSYHLSKSCIIYMLTICVYQSSKANLMCTGRLNSDNVPTHLSGGLTEITSCPLGPISNNNPYDVVRHATSSATSAVLSISSHVIWLSPSYACTHCVIEVCFAQTLPNWVRWEYSQFVAPGTNTCLAPWPIMLLFCCGMVNSAVD